ncbi:MAG: alpha/beta hydrolase [Gemmatimonadetes bacterium]|nr:alpha/beta hydrolase [Gemmatimonadota bacterium]
MAIALLLQGAAAASPQFVEVAPGDTIAVHVAGDDAAPPIVIVPGLLGSAYGFRNLVPPLIDTGYRVLIVDPLGTGDSPAPKYADYSLTAQADRIAAASRALGVRRAVFTCHAIGASMCYRLALRNADLVAGIVSINGGPAERLNTPGLSVALRFAPLIRLFGGNRIARGKVRDGLIDSSADPAWVTDEVVRGYTTMYHDGVGPVLSTLRRMSSAAEPEPLAPSLDDLARPVHLLVGAASRTGAIRAAEIDSLRAVPDLSVDSVAASGQYIHEEQPQAVLDAILAMAGRTGLAPLPSLPDNCVLRIRMSCRN